jgi:hypothetical protein
LPDGLFFQAPGEWTGNPAEAFDFRMIDRALRFAEVWQLKDVELAFSFGKEPEARTVPFEKIEATFSEP